MTAQREPLDRRLRAWKAINYLTGSPAALAVADRMAGFKRFQLMPPPSQQFLDYMSSLGYSQTQAKGMAATLRSETAR